MLRYCLVLLVLLMPQFGCSGPSKTASSSSSSNSSNRVIVEPSAFHSLVAKKLSGVMGLRLGEGGAPGELSRLAVKRTNAEAGYEAAIALSGERRKLPATPVQYLVKFNASSSWDCLQLLVLERNNNQVLVGMSLFTKSDGLYRKPKDFYLETGNIVLILGEQILRETSASDIFLVTEPGGVRALVALQPGARSSVVSHLAENGARTKLEWETSLFALFNKAERALQSAENDEKTAIELKACRDLTAQAFRVFSQLTAEERKSLGLSTPLVKLIEIQRKLEKRGYPIENRGEVELTLDEAIGLRELDQATNKLKAYIEGAFIRRKDIRKDADNEISKTLVEFHEAFGYFALHNTIVITKKVSKWTFLDPILEELHRDSQYITRYSNGVFSYFPDPDADAAAFKKYCVEAISHHRIRKYDEKKFQRYNAPIIDLRKFLVRRMYKKSQSDYCKWIEALNKVDNKWLNSEVHTSWMTPGELTSVCREIWKPKFAAVRAEFSKAIKSSESLKKFAAVNNLVRQTKDWLDVKLSDSSRGYDIYYASQLYREFLRSSLEAEKSEIPGWLWDKVKSKWKHDSTIAPILPEAP